MLPKIPLNEAREWLAILQFAISLFRSNDEGRARRAATRRIRYMEKQQDKLDKDQITQAVYDLRVANYDGE